MCYIFYHELVFWGKMMMTKTKRALLATCFLLIHSGAYAYTICADSEIDALIRCNQHHLRSRCSCQEVYDHANPCWGKFSYQCSWN